MPEFETESVFQAPPAAVWAAITDFPRYRAIVKEFSEAAVEERSEGAARVRFSLELPVRTVTYRLQYALEEGVRLSWTMVDSNTLKGNEGEWVLAAEGEGTRVRYRHKVTFPAWMSWAVTDKAFREEMDKTLARFRAAVEVP